MTSWILDLCLAAAVLAAVGVVALENPVRSTSALVTCFGAVAAALAALGAPVLPGVALWAGVGAVGLLLLVTVLLLNLSVDERGRRIVRLLPALTLPALAVVGAALFAVVWESAPRAPAWTLPDANAVALAVTDDLTLPIAVTLTALAFAIVAALVLVRRRA